MFGHKDGKVEKELKRILSELDEIKDKIFNREVNELDIGQIHDDLEKTIGKLKNVTKLSEQIHDLIDKEL